jgi:ribose transport system substrate-binding protein
MGALFGASWLVSCGGGSGGSGGNAGASADIGQPKTSGSLAPFDPNARAGSRPDLPKRVGYTIPNDREYAQAERDGVEAGARDRGLEFLIANSQDDASRNVSQIDQFVARGVGGAITDAINPEAQANALRAALEQGIAAMTVNTPPATTMVVADQYQIGEALAKDAADYIRSELGGNANVVILNQDSIEAVRPRFQAMRDAMGGVSGARVVADIEPEETDKEAAFQTMNTILQKNPEVDVVLGADAVSLGALAALEAAGKASPRMYVGGIDGEPEARQRIQQPDSPYKATVAFGTQIFGYGLSYFVGDWLEGKSIPQGIQAIGVLLDSADAIEQYETDIGDPTATWESQERRGRYVELFGNIRYDDRGQYLDYVWKP